VVVQIDHEARRVSAFFSNLISELGAQTATDTVAVCVAHVLPTSPPFLQSISEICPIAVLVPKPKSQDKHAVSWARKNLKCTVLEAYRETRDSTTESQDEFLARLIKLLQTPKLKSKKVVFIDIGGYFAPLLPALDQTLGDRFLGVMEGTENGAQEYDRLYPPAIKPPAPIVTVARSPLKLPEDYLVGSSIVFSIESILRDHNQILQTRSACVIGFGRVGSAVASSLRGRGIPTIVNDTHPVKMAEAAAQGYQVYPNVHDAVLRSSLIVSATSSAALDERVMASVRTGAAVATVTSRDTEFSGAGEFLKLNYNATPLDPKNVVRYDEKEVDRYFWLLNDGNAPNFLHGAVLGPALQLIEGEKLAAVLGLATLGEFNAIHARTNLLEVDEDNRMSVARVWNEHFIGI